MKYMIHLLGAEAGEVVVLGPSPEAIRATSDYKGFLRVGYEEKGAFQVLLESGKDILLDAYELEGV